MIVGGQTEARAQLSSTIIDYHEPFDQGLMHKNKHGINTTIISFPYCRSLNFSRLLHSLRLSGREMSESTGW